MKNPFEKKDDKVLVAGAVIGAIAAGTATYLFLTETGSQVRQKLTGYFGRIRNIFGTDQSQNIQSDMPAYLQHKGKAPKTDREALLKHTILHETAEHTNSAEGQS